MVQLVNAGLASALLAGQGGLLVVGVGDLQLWLVKEAVVRVVELNAMCCFRAKTLTCR